MGRHHSYYRHMKDKIKSPFRERGIYRSRSGMLLGVCKGLARYFDISLPMVRILTIIAFIFAGFWPVGVVYLVLSILMKPEPVVAPANDMEAEFYNSYASSRRMAVSRLKNTFDRLERRLRRLEDTVTSQDYAWNQKAKG